ncbi:MAG: hypothetical protein QOF35_1443 [Actinomycetota bacterium]|nr:hypothetical protein [Actinomycetota bacterium]
MAHLNKTAWSLRRASLIAAPPSHQLQPKLCPSPLNW